MLDSICFFRSLLLVRFPPIPRFIPAPRNDISSFVFSAGFSFKMASTSFHSVLFRFRQSRGQTTSFGSWKCRILLFARYLAFFSLFRLSKSFLSCSCLFLRVTTIMSSNQAGALDTSVQLICFLKYRGYIGKTVEPFFESVVSAKFFLGYRKYALSACFFGQFHLSRCVIWIYVWYE